MIADITIHDYTNNMMHKFSVNAAHLHHNSKPLRTDPIHPQWFDHKHHKVYEALRELEKALLEMVAQ